MQEETIENVYRLESRGLPGSCIDLMHNGMLIHFFTLVHIELTSRAPGSDSGTDYLRAVFRRKFAAKTSGGKSL